MGISNELRLLIADSSVSVRKRIRIELCENGYDPDVCFVSGLKGLSKAVHREEWSLILLDESMVGKKGIDFGPPPVIQEQCPETPVILLMDSFDRELARRAIRSGVQDVLSIRNLQRLMVVIEKESEGINRAASYPADEAVQPQGLREPDRFYRPELITTRENLSSAGDNRPPESQKAPAGQIKSADPKKLKLLPEVGDLAAARLPISVHRDETEFDGLNSPGHEKMEFGGLPPPGHRGEMESAGLKTPDNGQALLAMMSHELRTPIDSMILLSRLLMDERAGSLNHKQFEYSKVIHHTGNSLLEIINHVLDEARSEAGGWSISRRPANLLRICRNIERLFQPQANEKGVKFYCPAGDDNLDITIRTDWFRVEQILKNLLSNAFKFTEEGRIEVKVTVSGEAANNGDAPPSDKAPSLSRVPSPREKPLLREGTALKPLPPRENPSAEMGKSPGQPDDTCSCRLLFQVCDTGIGIPAGKQEEVFKRYRQADSDTEARFGGAGLGLAISRRAARLLGGDISLESEPGRGSRFSFYHTAEITGRAGQIPADSTEDLSGGRMDQTPNSDPVGKRDRPGARTVLLVDDSDLHSSALREYLHPVAENIIQASTAREAYSKMKLQDIDVIILDMILPDATGKEILETIRGNESWSRIPVIIYTGKNISGEDEKELRNLGAPVISKNINSFKMLKQKITNLTSG